MIKRQERLLFIDVLRTISIMMVILIHTTSNFFVSSYGTKEFIIVFLLSAITCSAVPIFYMISGAFMIKDNNIDFKKSFFKSIELFLQTVLWTLIYYLLFKYVLHWDVKIFNTIRKSFFSSQVGHLWFMYPLIGLYILSPLISLLYNNLSEKEKIYTLIFLELIPVLCATLQIWNNEINIPFFAIGFPELGLFILGKYIFEKREKLVKKRYLCINIIMLIIGVLFIYLLANYYYSIDGISSTKPYFDYNKIPVLMVTISIYGLFISLKNYINKIPKGLARFFTFTGTYTKGVYFIHMIPIYLFPIIKIFNLYFTANKGKLINMIIGALLYFIITEVIVLVISKIPIIKRIIK